MASMNRLRDEEKYKACNLLKDIKRHEKPLQTSQGMQGSYAEAVCSHIEPEDGKKDEPQVFFFCLPFFRTCITFQAKPVSFTWNPSAEDSFTILAWPYIQE